VLTQFASGGEGAELKSYGCLTTHTTTNLHIRIVRVGENFFDEVGEVVFVGFGHWRCRSCMCFLCFFGRRRFLVCGPQQIADLLAVTQVTSSDFNTVKALAQGDINSFLGFDFITSNLLTQDATPNRQVFAFAADGIKLGIGKDITAKISERDDKSYSTQVYYSMDLGATRMEEEKIVEIACVE